MKLSEQVAAQCRVVASLAESIATVHGQLAVLYGGENPPAAIDTPDSWRVVGNDTARRMEILGDILNSMDSASDEDEWVTPIFEEAHRLFPQKDDKVDRQTFEIVNGVMHSLLDGWKSLAPLVDYEGTETDVLYEIVEERLRKFKESSRPIPLILHCPRCLRQHVDLDAGTGACGDLRVHKTHLCADCGYAWQPAKIVTVGVKELPEVQG